MQGPRLKGLEKLAGVPERNRSTVYKGGGGLEMRDSGADIENEVRTIFSKNFYILFLLLTFTYL